MLFRWLVILTTLVAWANSCYAQQHPFIQYNTRDGLSQSQVRCIAQDSSGFLWFGTVGGASRFDGQNFRNFALREGLPDPHIEDILVTEDGVVWLATDQGLAYFTGDSMRVKPLPENIADQRINALSTDSDGNLLFTVNRKGLFRMTGSTVEYVKAYTIGPSIPIRCLLRTEDESILIGTRDGLLRLQGDELTVIRVGDHQEKSISSLAITSDGLLWVGTFGDGIFRLDGNGGSTQLTDMDGLLQNNIRSIEVDDGGRVWATSKFGLNLIEGNDVLSFTKYRGMPHDNILTAYQDNEGSIWFGTDGAGVLKYSGDRFVTYTTLDGLCNDLIMCTVADDRGDLWMGTYGSGVCRIDGMAMVNTLDGLPNNTVWCGIHDGQGQLYFGTSDGVCVLNKGIAQPLDAGGLFDHIRVFTLIMDQNGVIWCGTRNGAALIKPDGSVQDLEVGVKSVRAILHSSDTVTYMCSADGILQRGAKTDKLYTEKDGLSSRNVFCGALDSKQRLWVGTVNGLNCLTDTGIVHLQLGPDYGSNYINLLVIDENDQISLGTNNGLYIGNAESLLRGGRAEQFTEADGLRAGEFNLNSTYRDTLGRYWFGTSGGLLLHDPDGDKAKQPRPPRMHITGVRSFLKEIKWEGQSKGINETTGLPEELEIEHAKNYLTFDYVGVNLSEPEKVEYRYQLLGHDDEWLPETKARFASYSSLRYGDYTFQVKGRVPGGTWSSPTQFTFTVLRPFFLSWWFILLAAIAALATIWSIMKWRSKQRVANEKTKQLVLRSRMLQLEQQALNANMNRHFVFNALNSIQFYINKQEKVMANKYLTSFAKLIRKNLDNSQSDMTTLAEELERLELYLELEHMRFADKFDYTLDVSEGLDLISVPIPAMMLQPYVENSIWHGILPSERHGDVSICVSSPQKGRVQVEIQDNGIGIEESLARKQEGDHISKGIEITKGRADILRKMNKTDISITGPFQLNAPENGARTGTRVTIDLPTSTVPRY